MEKTDKAPAVIGDGVPIPSARPPGFIAKRIIVRELYRDDSGLPRYRRIDRRKKFIDDPHFYQLVARIAGYDDWHGTRDEEEDHVLDIPVAKPSYIVLKINGNLGPFNSPGIRLTTANDAYGELRHVTRNGTVSVGWPNEPCWVIYFAALFRAGNPYRQSLLYYPSQRTLVDPIDPDIRYPGNGGERD